MNDYKQLYTKSTKKSGGEPIIINIQDGFTLYNDLLLRIKLYNAIQDGTIYNVWIDESKSGSSSPSQKGINQSTVDKIIGFSKSFPYGVNISSNGPIAVEQIPSVYEGLDIVSKLYLQDNSDMDVFEFNLINSETNQLYDRGNDIAFTINGKSAIGQWDNGTLIGITTSDETFTYDNEPNIVDISQETANKLIGYINWDEFSGSDPNLAK